MEPTRGKGRKTLYFLRQLPLYDRKNFLHWLESPVLGNSPQFAKILERIENQLLPTAAETMDLKIFATLIQPEKEWDLKKEKYISIRLSQFQQKLFDFLAFKSYDENEAAKALNLLETCIQSGLDKYLESMYNKARKILQEPVSTGQLKDQMLLEEKVYTYMARNEILPEDTPIDKVGNSLDTFFILQKLKFACAALTEANLAGKNRPIRMIDTILTEVEQQPEAWPEIIRAYFHAFKMLKHQQDNLPEAEQHYVAFLTQFTGPVIPQLAEARDLFVYGQNFCILQIRAGKETYRDTLAIYYDFTLYAGIFEEENWLSPALYKNCVEVLCKIGLYESATKVTDQFKRKIHHQNREALFTYNQAVIQFHKNEFQGLYGTLYTLLGQFQSIQYEIGARVYLCRTLWKTQQYEQLTETLHAFAQFIFRHKEDRKVSETKYRSFITYMNRLANIMQGPADQVNRKINRLCYDLDQNEEASAYRWLRIQVQKVIEDQILKSQREGKTG